MFKSNKPTNEKNASSAVARQNFPMARQIRAARNPLHLLLVDDDNFTRSMLSNAFRSDFAIFESADGEDAIMRYLLQAPDMVVLDLGLPGMHGLEVLNEILRCDPDAYIVILSARQEKIVMAQAMSAGAKGYICKPFQYADIEKHIDACLNYYCKTRG